MKSILLRTIAVLFYSFQRRSIRLVATSLMLLAVAASAQAQSARWESADSGDPSELQLIFEDCAPEGEPPLPKVEGTTFTLAGTASQTTMNNFSFSRSTIMTYRARAQRSGTIQIPAFSVQTNKGAIKVAAFNGGAARSAADANIAARLEPGSNNVWAGEVFPLSYVLDVPRRSFNQFGSMIEWNPAPLVVEDWSKFEPSEAVVAGESRLRLSSNSRAFAKTPGPLVLNSTTQLVNVQSGSIGFGLFQTPRIEQLSVTSNRPSVVVRALPTPAAPGFSGAVGQFKLTSKVVPTTAAVGEPVTWTLELAGTGNWPDVAGLPSRDVSKDFNVVQPQAKRTATEGKLFEAVLTEDVVLVPTRDGKYTLGPVEFAYFDPSTGSYKTASTPRTTITITPPLASATSPTPAPSTSAVVTESPKSKGPPQSDIKSPPAPQGIPRDPLAGSSVSLTPMPLKRLVWLVLLPFAVLPILWLWLALTRARRTDPLRQRREAHARLSQTLKEIETATEARRSELLLRWQHDSAILWGISHAAPGALALTDPAWAKLWSEADQALYSAARALAPDWTNRAQAALKAKRVGSFSPLRLFLPQNLLPFVALISAIITLAPFARAENGDDPKLARSPDAAYRGGNFTVAEKIWRDSLVQKPTDAIARYNLSLALAQQDRWGEAVAHATASFVQKPANSPARWQLVLAAEKAGFLPSPVTRFLPPGPVQSLAQLASPGIWQVVLIGSSVIFVSGLAVMLFGLYQRRSRGVRWTAISLVAVGVLSAASSITSLVAYGVSADQRAVIAWRAGVLRSIPTESDTTQKTTTLGAGSVAVVDKTFLGSWLRLSFDNGQTGWVRKEDVIALWQ
ncbi:MAG: BatD family protein [Opitutus sp.]